MELATRYDPSTYEADVYQSWLDANAFAPSDDLDKPTFTIMIPPPNVTGVLHMGHALNNTVQDIVIRHKRMSGFAALWVPGTDHAGIATQAVVERKLFQEQGLKREDMGREAFLAKIWEWKEHHGDVILKQLESMGCSCDWSRTAFTLDDGMSQAVREAFVRLWKKELVYRGARLVNWDCELQTAVSDDEIEYVTRKTKLAYLKYPVKGEEGRFLTVATTRPETMLADTGVAVNPGDERYGDLVGKFCVLPMVGREIPIVADDSVDPEFGTGAVKITPGHDPADYERGARHNLPIINLLNKDGSLNDEGGKFAGLDRVKARKEVLAAMEELELLEKVDDYTHNVAISDRSKTVIEPLVSEQWFVKMKPLAEPAIKAAKDGSLQFRPERWSKTYLSWLEGVHDWCISRQLWWGHRIPVWYDEDNVPVASADVLEIGSPHPETGKPIVRQDPDVLDTWASSWLWPFATLGWPEKTADLARFYPTQFLATARDIIYLWVARMIMAGQEFLDDLPQEKRLAFATCYINATVLDAKGKRMSKSAGNGIDPLEMVGKYGADAVRYSLIMLTREGQDVKLAETRFEEGRRFTNKVWNAARFVLTNMEGTRTDGTLASAERLEDRWILSRLATVHDEVTLCLNEYRFNDGLGILYRFVWNDFCDWYLELSKPRLSEGESESARAVRGTLARVLRDVTRLLHPFIPFQTEVLWTALHDALGETAKSQIIVAEWPDNAGIEYDETAEKDMGVVQGLVHAVRNIRALTTLGDRKPLTAIVSVQNEAELETIRAHEKSIIALGFLEVLDLKVDAARPPASAVAIAGGAELFVPLGEDVDLEKLSVTLAGRVEKLRKGIGGVEGKLGNAKFVERADPEVVELERTRLGEMQHEMALLARNLEGLKG
ncbi:MAG: valyl-tRNA synthetase [Planctomycetota bacterium]|jgi:valyl-tRNA synthetase